MERTQQSLHSVQRETSQTLVRREPHPPLLPLPMSTGFGHLPIVSGATCSWASCPPDPGLLPMHCIWTPSELPGAQAALLTGMAWRIRLEERWQGHGIRLLLAQDHVNLNDFLLSYLHTRLC